MFNTKFAATASSIKDSSLLELAVYQRLSTSAFEHSKESIKELEHKIYESDDLLKLDKSKEKHKDDGFLTVYFANPSKELSKIALSSASIAHLRKNFNDVYELENGSFLLNNESAAYVAGWYKEISSLRNYKGADENGDSYIDDNEALNLKGFFHFKEFLICSDNPYATYVFDLKKYQSLSKLDNDLLVQVKDFFVEESINLALDKSLLLDMDLDGKILYKEAFSLRDLRNVSALLVNDAIGKELFQTSDMNEYFEHIRKFKEKMAKEVATKAEEEVKLVSDNDEEEKTKFAPNS